MSLQGELANLRAAKRLATGAATVDDGIVHVTIAANAAGDNVVIQPPGQLIRILELFLWNGVGAQALILKDGAIPLLQLTNVAAQQGIFFGYTGDGKAHFLVSPGNQFLLNLSVGSQIDGFVKYRVQS